MRSLCRKPPAQRCRALAGDAIKVLADLLHADDTPPALRRQVALDVLRASGISDPDPDGPSARRECDPDLLKADRLQTERDYDIFLAKNNHPTARSGVAPVAPTWTPMSKTTVTYPDVDEEALLQSLRDLDAIVNRKN